MYWPIVRYVYSFLIYGYLFFFAFYPNKIRFLLVITNPTVRCTVITTTNERMVKVYRPSEFKFSKYII